ncbi:vWA domain-containing protein [Clostridium formicaceticum]|uniref:Aerotolerance regulator N-terminal domain-containing protein n=1 Tax=Clostridium formicaceticum TaxID=1497 RepID=A0AAC9WFW7_9CLOT|nr:BatA and WFA domain-containing protein [Clostridium formicaceticum]AOY75879.1 hypothetical protein BJL90_08220 [Clostridium formicaceticum]ARE86220.1 hypothetical protein CLFO_05420 [Clostridium formicaceticum]
MSFLNPMALWMLLTTIIVLIIYFKKQQEIELKVSSIKLWQEVLAEAEKIKISKVNQYLLLLLQLAIILLIVMALSRPIIYGGGQKESVTILLDNSFSMQAISQGNRHLDLAKEEGKEYIHGLSRDVVINLMTINESVSLLLEEGSKAQALAGIEAIVPSQKPLNIEAMETIKTSLLSNKIFITDKSIHEVEGVIKVGEDLYNLGIIDVKYDYYENMVICSIRNYGASEVEARLLITDEGGRKYRQRKVIEGKQKKDILIGLEMEPEILKVVLEIEDMLQQDNEFLLGVGKDYKKEVLLIGENDFIEKALKSIRGINWRKSDKMKEGYDLYIIGDHQKYETTKPVWYLKAEDFLGSEEKQGTEKLTIRGYETSAEMISIENPIALKEKEGFQRIIEAGEKPLTIAGIEENNKVIYSSMDLGKTNLPMTPFFPIYVEEMLYWLLDEDFSKNMEDVNNPPGDFMLGETDLYVSPQKSWVPAVMKPQNIFIYLAMLLLFIEWKVYKNVQG